MVNRFAWLWSACSWHHTPVKYGQSSQAPPLPALPDSQQGEYLKSTDGRLWLFRREWAPRSECIATVIIIHGTIDHSGVYNELAEALAEAGVAVFAQDMRGWGHSDGESLYFHDVPTYLSDVAQLARHARLRYPDVKRVIMGKSLGGLVAALSVLEHPAEFDALIGLSGAFSLDPSVRPPHTALLVLRVLAKVFPKLPFRKAFDEHLIVSDEEALEEWRSDPLVSRDKLRLAYGATLFRAIDELAERVGEFKLPMLMMVGTDDCVVTRQGHEMMVNQSSSDNATLKLYSGGFHNLLAEPKLKHEVIGDVVSWVTETVE